MRDFLCVIGAIVFKGDQTKSRKRNMWRNDLTFGILKVLIVKIV